MKGVIGEKRRREDEERDKGRKGEPKWKVAKRRKHGREGKADGRQGENEETKEVRGYEEEYEEQEEEEWKRERVRRRRERENEMETEENMCLTSSGYIYPGI